MRRALDDGQLARAAQLGLCPPVELEHHLVGAAHDQQGRCCDVSEAWSGQVRTTATRHDRRDRRARLGRRPQRRSRSRARTEVADPAGRAVRPGAEPPGRCGQSLREQLDVEDVGAGELFLGTEQVEEEGAQAGALQHRGDEPVARAVAAAAAPVGEQHDAGHGFGKVQVTLEGDRTDGDRDVDVAVRGVPDRRHALHASRCGVEQDDDLLVARRGEVAVVVADRHELRWRRDAHDLVGSGQAPVDLHRGDGHGHDDSRGAEVACHLAGDARRGAGRDAVVDDDRDAPGQVDGISAPAQACDARRELSPFATLDRGQLVVGDPGGRQHPRVERARAALPDGPHGQLGLVGDAELADDDDVQRQVERLRHLEGHGYAASWQTQHHRVLTAQVLQPRRQLSAGVHAIGEDDHGGDPFLTYPSTMLLGGRCRSRCRWRRQDVTSAVVNRLHASAPKIATHAAWTPSPRPRTPQSTWIRRNSAKSSQWCVSRPGWIAASWGRVSSTAETIATTTVAAIAPAGTSLGVVRKSPTATSPVRDRATYTATPATRSSPLPSGTVDPESRVKSRRPKYTAPTTSATTAIAITAPATNIRVASALTASRRVRDTGTASRYRSVPACASPAIASPDAIPVVSGRRNGRHMNRAATTRKSPLPVTLPTKPGP